MLQPLPKRIYAFDLLKTTMMLLVLVTHAGLTYIVTDLGNIWPFKDPYSTSVILDVLVSLVSFISMPVFFAVSGYMTAMQFMQKGVMPMLKSRVKRILYPLLAGLLILYPLTVVGYFDLKFTIDGNPAPFLSALNKYYDDQFGWRYFRPIHLWFLYYLFLFCICGAAIATLVRKHLPATARKINKAFLFVYSLKPAPVLFAIVTFILVCFRGKYAVEIPGSFAINYIVFITYFFFFGFGWLLYYQKEHLMRFIKGNLFFTITGFCCFLVQLTIINNKAWDKVQSIQYLSAALNCITVWFMVFGLIGLFLRYFNKFSARAAYISEASYWIYLIHFPIVFFLQGLFIYTNLNVFVKFLLVVAITLTIAIVTFHFLVRNTFIGVFLNGAKSKSPKAIASKAV